MSKLVLNVKYLILLSFLNAAELYNLGHIQGIKKGALTQKRSFLVICTTFRSNFLAEKIKKTFNTKFVIPNDMNQT